MTTQAPGTAIAPATNGNGKAIQQEQPKYANTLHAFLDRSDVKTKLAEVADKFMKPEDLIRLALMAASRNQDLLKCTPESVLLALMDAAAMGIVPGGINGRGFLVPRRNSKTGKTEAKFDPGWRGFEDIAKRSGKITKIEAHAVYTADEYKVTLGDNPSIHHVPNFDAEDRGTIKAGYAIAFYTDGTKQAEPLSKADIAKIRAVSPAKDNGPWVTWESEQVRKSAVRRLCKHLPVYDAAMERALAATAEEDIDAKPALPSGLTPGDTASLEAALLGSGGDAFEHDADGVIVEQPDIAKDSAKEKK